MNTNMSYIHIPKWVDNEFGFIKGERLWVRLEGKRIILQREKPEPAYKQVEKKQDMVTELPEKVLNNLTISND